MFRENLKNSSAFLGNFGLPPSPRKERWGISLQVFVPLPVIISDLTRKLFGTSTDEERVSLSPMLMMFLGWKKLPHPTMFLHEHQLFLLISSK